MSKHARTPAPGLQLNGREVAADAQLLILSFLSLKELTCLRSVSHGWRAKAEEALTRLMAFTVGSDDPRALDEALRWCRRLQTLTVERGDARIAQLIVQNQATLTAITIPFFHIEAVWDAAYECRTLRRLQNWDTRTISEAEVSKLLSSFPQLEDFSAFSFDWDAFLSSPTRLPLTRLATVVPLGPSQLSQLVSSYPDLVEVDISFSDIDPTSLFEALSRLPGLERACLTAGFTLSASTAPPPPESKRLVLKALHSLELRWIPKEHKLSDFLHFSAPGLRKLTLPSSLTLPVALLIERFPALTDLSIEAPYLDERSDDSKAAAALLSRDPKPWAQLSRLKFRDSLSRRFAFFLSRLCSEGRLSALTELEIVGGETEGHLLLPLRTLPALKALRISCLAWKSAGDVDEAAASDFQVVTHGLEKLRLGYNKLAFSTPSPAPSASQLCASSGCGASAQALIAMERRERKGAT